MRRLLLVLLFPVVWLPLLALALLAVPALPWWSWPVAAAFWVLMWRRRRAGALEVAVDPGAARFSPVAGRGGY